MTNNKKYPLTSRNEKNENDDIINKLLKKIIYNKRQKF